MASIFRPSSGANEPPKKEEEHHIEVGPSKHILWRQEQLLAAGFDEVQAALIAGARQIDLHKAVDLAQKAGPELATKILL